MEHNSPQQLNSFELDPQLDAETGLALINDVELCDLVRSGSSDAFAELFKRYRHPTLRLARYYSSAVDPDDVVSEVFAQVLSQLQRGSGPDSAVRAYIFTAVRREVWKRARALKRVVPTDNPALIDRPVQFEDDGIDMSERDTLASAELGACVGHVRLVDIADDDVHPLGQQRLADAEADAARSPGDECGLAGKVPHARRPYSGPAGAPRCRAPVDPGAGSMRSIQVPGPSGGTPSDAVAIGPAPRRVACCWTADRR